MQLQSFVNWVFHVRLRKYHEFLRLCKLKYVFVMWIDSEGSISELKQLIIMHRQWITIYNWKIKFITWYLNFMRNFFDWFLLCNYSNAHMWKMNLMLIDFEMREIAANRTKNPSFKTRSNSRNLHIKVSESKLFAGV